MQTASLLAEKAAGYIPDEELSTGGTQPITRDGEKMHAIVWHGNYDVRCAKLEAWESFHGMSLRHWIACQPGVAI
jgi:hypothetical protein